MSKETMQKPLGLIRKELQEKIINAVNESGLPLSMSAYIVKEILDGINATVAQQESAEIAEYEAKLANFNKEE
jgi:hypothetical protein